MYECHITYENVDPETEKLLAETAAKWKWKTSWIEGDPALGPGKRFYLTTHARTEFGISSEMRAMAEYPGLPKPIRQKIEHIIHDTKYGIYL